MFQRRVLSGVALALAAFAASCGGTDTVPYAGTQGLESPNGVKAAYPAGPYGTKVGDVVADATFFGYPSVDQKVLTPIALHDFYDPDGSKGNKLIFFSAGAVWCPPCNAETEGLAQGEGGSPPSVYEDEKGKGVVFFQDLYEGANQKTGAPATESDLAEWVDSYQIPFWVVIDPKKKMEPYFDVATIPFSMVIDARTMKILETTTGYGGVAEVESFIESHL